MVLALGEDDYVAAKSNNETTYASFGNVIAITAKGKTVQLDAGQTVTIPMGNPPQEPKPHSIPSSYLRSFAVRGSLEGLESLAEKKSR